MVTDLDGTGAVRFHPGGDAHPLSTANRQPPTANPQSPIPNPQSRRATASCDNRAMNDAALPPDVSAALANGLQAQSLDADFAAPLLRYLTLLVR